MELENKPMEAQTGVKPPEAMAPTVQAIGPEQLKKFMQILQKYKAGKSQTENRIIASENWWKLRNSIEEQKTTSIGKDGGFQSVSGWLHNVIVSKHADAMESYPEPNILPREPGDQQEAQILSDTVIVAKGQGLGSTLGVAHHDVRSHCYSPFPSIAERFRR